jgi:hypothetical protein
MSWSSLSSMSDRASINSIDSDDVEMEVSNYLGQKKNEFSEMLRKFIENGDKNTHKTKQQILDKFREIIGIMKPLTIIYNVERFYLAENEQIDLYIDTFRDLAKYHEGLFKYIFRIKKVLPIQSSNGKIFILKSLTPELSEEDMDIDQLVTPNLLVKVALSSFADPISYEYYVGLTLNKLRTKHNVQHFTIMYGKFFCGLNPQLDASLSEKQLENMETCDARYPRKVHLLYEYIRSHESNEVISLYDYIMSTFKRHDAHMEEQLVNLVIMILYSLQIAQDELNFTHYDLHLGNILVIKLDYKMTYSLEYKGHKFSIETEYVPHIIDYGRSHINPSKAESDRDDYKFMDDENDILYNTFAEFQKKSAITHIMNRNNNLHIIDSLEKRLHRIAYQYVYKTEPTSPYDTFETLEFKKFVFNTYCNGEYKIDNNNFTIEKYDIGIDTTKFNKAYDMVRLIKLICSLYKMNKKTSLSEMWLELDTIIDENYPYMDEIIYAITSDYKNNPMELTTQPMKSPIDICKWLDARML